MQNLLLVFIGGGLGAVCRYISTTHIGALFGTYFPFGTLFVNTLGSLLMGFIMGSLVFLMEKTGLRLAEPAPREQAMGAAAMNIAANLGLCFLAAFLGLSLARALTAF